MKGRIHMIGVPFCPAEILIPKENLEKWSVVACDQYTSQPEYWDQVEKDVEGYPSAYNLIIPEAYLENIDYDEKVGEIKKTMKKYVRGGIFDIYRNIMVYTERTLKNGKVRHGVIGVVDLKEYDYKKGAKGIIRATEATVEERIPARVQVRENALLEIPHIMLLIDDPDQTVIEQFAEGKENRKKLYDFDLGWGGGHIEGYELKGPDYRKIMHSVKEFSDLNYFSQKYNVAGRKPLVFAVGDGNHSLAAAKVAFENRSHSGVTDDTHPSRYALVEVVNLHDESLEFEAIHRAVFGVDADSFVAGLKEYCAAQNGNCDKQSFTLVVNGNDEVIEVAKPEHTLAVGTVQEYIDQYLKDNGGKVDYIHGEDVTRDLAGKGAVGILLPAMKKEDLFPTIILEGALPRKTFSMGVASDKRYYLESRKIR